MAFNALLFLGILSSMVFAMIPPCLPHLGPEFCPSTSAATPAAAAPKWPAEPVTYPNQMHQEEVLRDRVFPRIDKKRMIVNTKLFTTRDNNFPQYFPNRHCKSKFGALVKQWLGYQAYGAVYVALILRSSGPNYGANYICVNRNGAYIQLPNTTSVVSFSSISNETPQGSLIVRFLSGRDLNEDHDIIAIGAHVDSINHKASANQSLPDEMVAPGADDNASGLVVVFETMQILARLFLEKPVLNEVQFHF